MEADNTAVQCKR